MKLLIIGIDGGDERVVRGVGMSRLSGLLDSLSNLDVREDLWTRGWASILSGRHGRDTAAFYNKPKLDGSHEFTQSFNRLGYDARPDIVPIWELLRRRDVGMGLMNVPTTMPAPDVVDGFYVAGAGGGIGGGGEVEAPIEGCTPGEISRMLLEERYILDTRFVRSGLREPAEIIRRMSQMQRRRTRGFRRLAEHFEPDVGFIAYMATSRLQNLAASEIAGMLGDQDPPNHGPLHDGMLRLYGELDEQIGELVDTLSPEAMMIVSDHGTSPYLYSVNVQPALAEAGLLTTPQGGLVGSPSMYRRISRRMPDAVKRMVKAGVPRERRERLRGEAVDWDRTRAFGARYVSGVYANDERFGGPVCEAERSDVVGEIMEVVNQREESRHHGMKARPYRELYPDAPFSDLLPDVWIDKPDILFFEGRGDFVEENYEYGPVLDPGLARRDMYTGVKGSRPLLYASPELSALRRESDPDDLTLAYRLIDRWTA